MIVRRSASGNRSRFSSTALPALQRTVVAPAPSATVRIATAVRPGVFRNVRIAYLRSANMSSSLADRADRPGRLLADARVGILQRRQESPERARVADRAERPRGLLPHAAARV